MSDEEALFRAICEHPDEDTPRLAYADWLDEHDQPERAEFIRAQVELARLPPEDDDAAMAARRAVLLRRTRALLRQHGKQWKKRRGKTTRAVRALKLNYYFARGFPDFPTGFVTDFLAAGDAFFAHHPVGEVCVRLSSPLHTPDPAWLPELLRQPWLLRVRALDVEGSNRQHPSDWGPVFRAEKLGGVERLSLNLGRLGPPEPAGGGFLPRLRSLTVLDWVGGPGHIRNLLDAIPHDRLTSLKVGLSRWTADDVAAVLDCPKLANLDHFDMAPERSGADQHRDQAALLLRLGAAPIWKRLRAADLSWTWGELARHLPELPPAPALRSVRFSGSTATTPAEVAAIAASPLLRTVTRLSFSGGWSGAENLRALLASPHLGKLADLSLIGCRLGPEGARLLAESPVAAGLVRLDLRSCGIRKAGAEALAASPLLKRLEYLDVDAPALGPAAVALLRKRFGDAVVV